MRLQTSTRLQTGPWLRLSACSPQGRLSAARLIKIGTHSAWSGLWVLTRQRSKSKKFLSIVIAIDNNIVLGDDVGYDVGAPELSAWVGRRCRAAAGVIRRSNQALPAPLDKIQIQNTKYTAPALAGKVSIFQYFS